MKETECCRVLGRAMCTRPKQRVEHHFENATVESEHRKPLPTAKEAISAQRRVERRAMEEGLDMKRDCNWPQAVGEVAQPPRPAR